MLTYVNAMLVATVSSPEFSPPLTLPSLRRAGAELRETRIPPPSRAGCEKHRLSVVSIQFFPVAGIFAVISDLVSYLQS